MNPGKERILADWFARFTPTDTLDADTSTVLTTENIISELSDMADWDFNEVADFMAQQGVRYFPDDAGLHGWLLRFRTTDNE